MAPVARYLLLLALFLCTAPLQGQSFTWTEGNLLSVSFYASWAPKLRARRVKAFTATVYDGPDSSSTALASADWLPPPEGDGDVIEVQFDSPIALDEEGVYYFELQGGNTDFVIAGDVYDGGEFFNGLEFDPESDLAITFITDDCDSGNYTWCEFSIEPDADLWSPSYPGQITGQLFQWPGGSLGAIRFYADIFVGDYATTEVVQELLGTDGWIYPALVMDFDGSLVGFTFASIPFYEPYVKDQEGVAIFWPPLELEAGGFYMFMLATDYVEVNYGEDVFPQGFMFTESGINADRDMYIFFDSPDCFNDVNATTFWNASFAFNGACPLEVHIEPEEYEPSDPENIVTGQSFTWVNGSLVRMIIPSFLYYPPTDMKKDSDTVTGQHFLVTIFNGTSFANDTILARTNLWVDVWESDWECEFYPPLALVPGEQYYMELEIRGLLVLFGGVSYYEGGSAYFNREEQEYLDGWVAFISDACNTGNVSEWVDLSHGEECLAEFAVVEEGPVRSQIIQYVEVIVQSFTWYQCGALNSTSFYVVMPPPDQSFPYASVARSYLDPLLEEKRAERSEVLHMLNTEYYKRNPELELRTLPPENQTTWVILYNADGEELSRASFEVPEPSGNATELEVFFNPPPVLIPGELYAFWWNVSNGMKLQFTGNSYGGGSMWINDKESPRNDVLIRMNAIGLESPASSTTGSANLQVADDSSSDKLTRAQKLGLGLGISLGGSCCCFLVALIVSVVLRRKKQKSSVRPTEEPPAASLSAAGAPAPVALAPLPAPKKLVALP